MLFEWKLGLRYLLSTRLQSSLLVLGVAVGVVVFTFIASLINGLGTRLTDDIIGNLAHVTLEPPKRTPRPFMASPRGRALYAVQPGNDVRPTITTYRPILALAAALPDVRAAVPEVLGNATLVRGEKDLAVQVTGIEQRDAGEIARLDTAIVRGRLDLGVGNLVVGQRLAQDLGIDVGDRVLLRPGRKPSRTSGARSTDVVMTVAGVFELGVQALDERAAFMDLSSARSVFGVADGVSQIELKVKDPWQAEALAARLSRATDLDVSNWLERNQKLREGLSSQQRTGSMIKGFSLITIVIGVASALLLAVLRRRPEIGILRSFGVPRGRILRAFVFEGLLVGLVGSVLGALLGFAFCETLFHVTMRATGKPAIPIDPAQGEYLSAILLATLASGLAAVLPARSAARIDPLKAIQS